MLLVRARRVLLLPHDAEVVEHLALVDGRVGLGDELRAPHVLPVPEGRVVEGELRALGGRGVGRVLVVRRELHVGGYGGGPVDVPLVGPDLVGPVPVLEVGGGAEVVEAAVPEDGCAGERKGGEDGGELHRGAGVSGRGERGNE